ncbi:MAG: DUF4249 family protein [Ignavibacteriales bacterium]|nr:DUF4249 family protein [Ignavibacteriales bacterium]
MKKTTYYLVILALTGLSISCEETFSPKGELQNKYSINLILRSDTTFQTAYISKAYDVQGFDPQKLTTDPAVDGAVISLKYSDSPKQYFFRDTVDNGNINTRFNTPAKYYYIKNFRPVYGKQIELNVALPDGQKLLSVTNVPEGIYFDEAKTLPFLPGPFIGNDTVYINVVWKNSNSNTAKTARAYLNYYHKELNGDTVGFVKRVPVAMDISGSDTSYVMSKSVFENKVQIPRKLLDIALRQISAGDSKKGRYLIGTLNVEIMVLDDNLSKYFSSEQFFNYGFTVRNFPADFTDITGGFGFFGSYSYTKRVIQFDPKYLISAYGYLGYQK